MSTFISILVFILILAILVVVHEFGHFITAKKNGVRVDEFGFGFPPRIAKLFRWKGTLFTLNLIPFGGFVKIFGENGDESSEKEGSFSHASKGAQARILFAGPLFNFLLAFVLFSGLYVFGTPAIVDDASSRFMKDVRLAVVEVAPDSPAEQAGILAGDQITALRYGIETFEVETMEDITHTLAMQGTRELTVDVLRRGEVISTSLTPQYGLFEGQEAPVLGVYLEHIGTLTLPIHKALWEGFLRTIDVTWATITFLVNMIGGLIGGDSSLAGAVTGPVGIVPAVGDALQIGFSFVVVMTALISINLAIINLLPFPALDGGRLLFVAIEAIQRRPISPRVSAWANGLGFVILLGLMLLVTIRDIIQLAK